MKVITQRFLPYTFAQRRGGCSRRYFLRRFIGECLWCCEGLENLLPILGALYSIRVSPIYLGSVEMEELSQSCEKGVITKWPEHCVGSCKGLSCIFLRVRIGFSIHVLRLTISISIFATYLVNAIMAFIGIVRVLFYGEVLNINVPISCRKNKVSFNS